MTRCPGGSEPPVGKSSRRQALSGQGREERLAPWNPRPPPTPPLPRERPHRPALMGRRTGARPNPPANPGRVRGTRGRRENQVVPIKSSPPLIHNTPHRATGSWRLAGDRRHPAAFHAVPEWPPRVTRRNADAHTRCRCMNGVRVGRGPGRGAANGPRTRQGRHRPPRGLIGSAARGRETRGAERWWPRVAAHTRPSRTRQRRGCPGRWEGPRPTAGPPRPPTPGSPASGTAGAAVLGAESLGWGHQGPLISTASFQTKKWGHGPRAPREHSGGSTGTQDRRGLKQGGPPGRALGSGAHTPEQRGDPHTQEAKTPGRAGGRTPRARLFTHGSVRGSQAEGDGPPVASARMPSAHARHTRPTASEPARHPGTRTHQLLLLSKKRTRNSLSSALVCMCSPTFSTSSGGAGMVTPLWWPGTRGILGSMICQGRTRVGHV